MAAERNTFSVVVAAFNEEGNIPVLYDRLARLDWAGLGLDPEFIFVDDHSTDRTPAVLADIAGRDRRVKVLRFSKNFGSHKAFTAGLEQCGGAAAVILAADLQDPPETIPDLVDKWRNGAKIVWAVRAAQPGENPGSRISSRFYYWLMRRYSEVNPPPTGADFLLVDRQAIDALRASPERNTSLLSLIQWLGFDQASIVYDKGTRGSGSSKWTWRKKLKLAIDSFVSFSYAPVRLMGTIGAVFALAGFAYAAIIVFRALAFGTAVEGWASLMCVLLIVSGVQLLMLGVLGEYLWRAFDESRGRPRYVIEKRINI